MTAIAYRDGIMAADTMAWQGGNGCGVWVPCPPKIRRLSDGSLVGACGRGHDCEVAALWLDRSVVPGTVAGGIAFLDPPPKLDAPDALDLLLVRPDGSCWRCGGSLSLYHVPGPWQVLGAPTAFLHGALAAGATAEQAVRLAMRWTDGAGGDEPQVERVG